MFQQIRKGFWVMSVVIGISLTGFLLIFIYTYVSMSIWEDTEYKFSGTDDWSVE